MRRFIQVTALIGAVLAACMGTLTASEAQADESDFLLWHTTNVQGLRGWDYELGPSERYIITLEHANVWRYGDSFSFCDLTIRDGAGDGDLYCEIGPRLSLSKISGREVSKGRLKDVLLSGQVELGEHGLHRYNMGLGFNIKLPAFKFFKFNTFLRTNPQRDSRTYQFYTAWAMPIDAFGAKFVFEGFADYIGDEGPGFSPSFLTQPRFLLDVGHLAGGKSGKLFAGVEYSYWRNKFGVTGVLESLPQFQIKAVF